MSRKATPEQNDISLIFGNLPKRLQMKIAANCKNNAAAADAEANADNEIPTTTTTTALGGACAAADADTDAVNIKSSKCSAHVDIKVETPVLEASGSTIKPITTTTTTTANDTCIPGILRLNATEANHLKQKQKEQQPYGKNRNRVRTRGKTYPTTAELKSRELLLPASPARIRLTTEHPKWFEELVNMPDMQNVIQLYDQLMILLERDLLLTNWNTFCEIHEKLQRSFKKLVSIHLKFSCEQKIDAFFWKLLLYNIREYLKSQNTKDALKRILALIDQAQSFYVGLLEDLKAKYFTIPRYESIARVVAQRILICLGDLCRYRAIHLQAADFVDTFKYYHQAQALIPANGAPYNQLAIVAVHARKIFDAVYYYVRSLLAKNSVQSAKESLLDLFEDIRKRYEETELKRSPLHQNAVQQNNPKSIRKEVWIYPDGVRRLHRNDLKGFNKNKTTYAEQERFDEMPTDELLKRITELYLYLIGKFYTGIGMESVYQNLRKLFIELSAALKHQNLLTRSKILKIVALNIFIMEHNKHKDSRREIRYHAFNFSNTIFGLLLRKANQILITPKQSDHVESLEDEFIELNTALQYIRIYVQWLALNIDIWEPIRNEDHSFIDCWQDLKQLFSNIRHIFAKHNDDFDIQLKHITLDEDIVLNGFTPLGRCTTTVNAPALERMQFLKRIKKISEFEVCFEEYQDYLQVSLNSSFVLEELNNAMQNALNDFSTENNDSDDVDATVLAIETNNNDENVAPCSTNMLPSSTKDAKISQLSKLKRELEAETKAKQRCHDKLEEILKFVDTKIYIEVRPRYLLPDTNCFIDCVNEFEELANEFLRYTLIIPLTVVKELDGLSKGVKVNMSKYAMQKQRIHHYDEVSSNAKKSLEFIKKAKNVKCATTKGSIINASLFALVEEEYASNDDKILATAVSLSKNLSSEKCKDGKCFIQTELVLITTDRNLRVKALSRNLAVSALDEFMQWAKNSNGT